MGGDDFAEMQMRWAAWIAAGVLFTFVVWQAGKYCFAQAFGISEIEYRGESFQLSKKYIDYDDYKNDQANIAEREIPRIEKLMTEVRIGPVFQDRSDFGKQSFEIKFPGYGSGPGPKSEIVGRKIITRKLEIPRTGKARYFVAEESEAGQVRLLDDFVALDQDPSAFAYMYIATVRLVDDKLIYADRRSNVVREAPIR
jgi:hypothetical protein